MCAFFSSVPRSARHADLVLPVVVVGAVVVHHDQHRDLVLGRHPQRAGIEHQVAVGLDVDDELAGALVRQRDAERDADLRRGAELVAGRAVGLVEVPLLAHLVLQVVGRQHPVVILDHVVDLVAEARHGDRRRVPVLARLLLPLAPRSSWCARRSPSCASRSCPRASGSWRCRPSAAWSAREWRPACRRSRAPSTAACGSSPSPTSRCRSRRNRSRRNRSSAGGSGCSWRSALLSSCVDFS